MRKILGSPCFSVLQVIESWVGPGNKVRSACESGHIFERNIRDYGIYKVEVSKGYTLLRESRMRTKVVAVSHKSQTNMQYVLYSPT